jgi:apolipoprotein N-acyltransferase
MEIGKIVFLCMMQVVLFLFSWSTSKVSFSVIMVFVPFFLILERSKTTKAIMFNLLLCYVLLFFEIIYRCRWITNTHVFGGALVFILLSVSYFLPVLAFTLFKKCTYWIRYFMFILSWLSIEYLYNTWELGFPYLDLGYILGNYPSYISFYQILGVRGGSLFILIINVLLYDIVRGLNRKATITYYKILICIIVLIIPVCYFKLKNNIWPYTKVINVMVVHPHTPVKGFKYNVSVDSLIEYQISKTRLKLNMDIDLICWPEGAVTGKNYVFGIKDNNFERIFSFLDSLENTAILTGAIFREEFSHLSTADKLKPVKFDIDKQDFSLSYNGAIILTKDRSYNEVRIKEKLVPFDEKVPYPKFFLYLSKYIEPSGQISFQNRSINKKLLEFNEIKCFPSICYELMFSEYCRKQVNKGANLIVNIANEGRINDSLFSESMLNVARIRAIENNRWVVKSTNQGVSAIIDNEGNITHVMRKKVSNTLVSDIELIETKTIYSKYGDLLGRLSPILVLLVLLYISLFKIVNNWLIFKKE